jgi:hypothetical protein
MPEEYALLVQTYESPKKLVTLNTLQAMRAGHVDSEKLDVKIKDPVKVAYKELIPSSASLTPHNTQPRSRLAPSPNVKAGVPNTVITLQKMAKQPLAPLVSAYFLM